MCGLNFLRHLPFCALTRRIVNFRFICWFTAKLFVWTCEVYCETGTATLSTVPCGPTLFYYGKVHKYTWIEINFEVRFRWQLEFHCCLRNEILAFGWVENRSNRVNIYMTFTNYYSNKLHIHNWHSMLSKNYKSALNTGNHLLMDPAHTTNLCII